MKFVTYSAIAALLFSSAESVTSLRKHHRHPHGHEYLATLPDVRADTVADADIAAHEAARSEAAKVKKNPQSALLQTIKADLETINADLSFGISFSQTKRNDHARETCLKVAKAIKDYTGKLLAKVEGAPNEVLTTSYARIGNR